MMSVAERHIVWPKLHGLGFWTASVGSVSDTLERKVKCSYWLREIWVCPRADSCQASPAPGCRRISQSCSFPFILQRGQALFFQVQDFLRCLDKSLPFMCRWLREQRVSNVVGQSKVLEGSMKPSSHFQLYNSQRHFLPKGLVSFHSFGIFQWFLASTGK